MISPGRPWPLILSEAHSWYSVNDWSSMQALYYPLQLLAYTFSTIFMLKYLFVLLRMSAMDDFLCVLSNKNSQSETYLFFMHRIENSQSHYTHSINGWSIYWLSSTKSKDNSHLWRGVKNVSFRMPLYIIGYVPSRLREITWVGAIYRRRPFKDQCWRYIGKPMIDNKWEDKYTRALAVHRWTINWQTTIWVNIARSLEYRYRYATIGPMISRFRRIGKISMEFGIYSFLSLYIGYENYIYFCIFAIYCISTGVGPSCDSPCDDRQDMASFAWGSRGFHAMVRAEVSRTRRYRRISFPTSRRRADPALFRFNYNEPSDGH